MHYICRQQTDMSMIKTIKGMEPRFGKNCYVAETAAVVGDVVMGDECSIWYSAVVRGDMERIRMGSRVNVQDCAVLHTTPGFGDIVIGNEVTIGHNATVHGAKIEDKVLVGMGATLLDDCHIGEGAIIAAGALVLKNTQVGPRELWGGVPARFIKHISDEQVERMIMPGVEEYVEWSRLYMEENPDTAVHPEN